MTCRFWTLRPKCILVIIWCHYVGFITNLRPTLIHFLFFKKWTWISSFPEEGETHFVLLFLQLITFSKKIFIQNTTVWKYIWLCIFENITCLIEHLRWIVKWQMKRVFIIMFSSYRHVMYLPTHSNYQTRPI